MTIIKPNHPVYSHIDEIPKGRAKDSITPGCMVIEGGSLRAIYACGVLDALMSADHLHWILSSICMRSCQCIYPDNQPTVSFYRKTLSGSDFFTIGNSLKANKYKDISAPDPLRVCTGKSIK